MAIFLIYLIDSVSQLAHLLPFHIRSPKRGKWGPAEFFPTSCLPVSHVILVFIGDSYVTNHLKPQEDKTRSILIAHECTGELDGLVVLTGLTHPSEVNCGSGRQLC